MQIDVDGWLFVIKQGLNGAVANRGLPGPKGEIGDSGEKGEKGDRGELGDAGSLQYWIQLQKQSLH